MNYKKIIYSGMCVCGHSVDRHHLFMVANPEIEKIVGSYIPGACLFFGFNENEGYDEDGNDHCYQYIDVNNHD